jgi:hypothetical protein
VRHRFFWLVLGAAALGSVATSLAIAAKDSPASASFLNDRIPIGTDTAGRTWNLGGFSALTTEGSSGDEYWTVTDRGPNDDANRANSAKAAVFCASLPAGKVIMLPGFNPQLIKVHIDKGTIKVQDRVLLHDGGHPATGLANLVSDETSWVQATAADAASKTCTTAPRSAFGVDTEGIVQDPRDSSFWLSDEYRPSILHVSGGGQILSRIIPKDVTIDTSALNTATGYKALVTSAGGTFAVQDEFPGILNGFRRNRGFEGIAIAPDGQFVYTAMQSSLDYQAGWAAATPAVTVTNGNRNLARRHSHIRVFRIDVSNPAAPSVDREWIYEMSRGFVSDDSNAPDRISDVGYLAPDVLLIEERDDARPTAITHVFKADFTSATNLLDPSNAAVFAYAANAVVPTLEMADLPASITPSTNTIYVDLDQLLSTAGFQNSKIEGIANLRARGANPALSVAVNDNDFDLDHTAIPGDFPNSNPTQVDVFAQP